MAMFKPPVASRRAVLAFVAGALAAPAMARLPARAAADGRIAGGSNGIAIEFDSQLRSRVRSGEGNGGKSLLLSDFGESEYFVTDGKRRIALFAFTGGTDEPLTEGGAGRRYVVRGVSADGIAKTVTITIRDQRPNFAVMRVEYRNTSSAPIRIAKWVNGAHRLKAGKERGPAFWSWHGASHEDRRDWVLPIDAGFEQRNFMGMNASDYGGGTPIVDVWRRDAGLAVGHVETVPKLVALPVMVTFAGAALQVEYDAPVTLAPGAATETFTTFVAVHRGDHFATLASYRAVMADAGLVQGAFPGAAYEPVWCAWGYDRNFDTKDIIATLPKAKALGLVWAGLDDGWQTAEGDWKVDKRRFARGEADMAAFAKATKAAGLKPKLWIAPLAVDPGTDLLHDHVDMLLLDKSGAVQDVSWWNAFTLCPAYQPVIDNARALVRKAMTSWDFDGLKLDGQHLNGVGPCYNQAHGHKRPEESVERLQHFWKAIYDEALAIKPDAVVEICPCGTAQAFHNLAYQNQVVASDPLSSWQVRLKGKTMKALMGPSAPYCGDHVELSDGGNDFASSFGIGAVLATKFTLPGIVIPEPGLALTADKEKLWAKWIGLYRDKMLPMGSYRGELYDIGFDKPEAHAIEKAGVMHYAFYADRWTGPIELRGLPAGRHALTDGFTGEALGETSGTVHRFEANFEKFLLVEARPVAA